MAGSAFKSADVIKLFSNFTPILVDGPSEKPLCAKFACNGYPQISFADVKGEPVGQPIIGYMETPAFLQRCEAIAKNVNPGHPAKEYAAVLAAKAELDKALAKKDTAASLAAIAKLEKLNQPGDELDAALAAKKQLLEDGAKRLEAARETAKTDKSAAAKELRKLAQEFKGTDVATEATKLAKELEPPADAPR